MIHPDEVTAAIRIVRAEESWVAVTFAGLIPFLGSVAVLYVVWRAVRATPDNEPPEDDPIPPPASEDDGHEGPLF